ncbi:MAG TPA: hypothetical protein VGR14_03990, partial [Verrucomicrobiae bacterium]|nr:hypothetical protein [Verrucomicrobiae bacterium]
RSISAGQFDHLPAPAFNADARNNLALALQSYGRLPASFGRLLGPAGFRHGFENGLRLGLRQNF